MRSCPRCLISGLQRSRTTAAASVFGHRRSSSSSPQDGTPAIIMQNISSKTVLDDLPEAVIIKEILVRLPAEDILRCRVVRKSWRHATSTLDFLLAHHDRQPSLPVIDLLKREGIMFDRQLFVYFDASPGATSRKLSQKTILWYPNPCPDEDNLVIHGSCDGLLVVSFCDSEYKEYFDVCNPITRHRAPLPLLPDHAHDLPFPTIRIAGFYQHLTSGEYRVLYFLTSTTVNFHVLAVGYNESRPIKAPLLQHGLLDRLTCSKNAPVLIRGNLHWLLAQYYTSDEFRNIIVFDTEVETFQWMGSSLPLRYSWMSLLELDGALAMCSSPDGRVIDISVMNDYKAEVWTPTYQINLSALEASSQLDLRGRILCKIATLNGCELLIQLSGWVLHYDLDGKFLGKMEYDEDRDNRILITPFRFQENIVPLPLFGMQEDYGDIRMPEAEGDDERQYSIWP